MTYHEDVAAVKDSFKIMIDDKEIFSERLCPEDRHELLKQIFSYPEDEQKKVSLYTDINIPRFLLRNSKI